MAYNGINQAVVAYKVRLRDNAPLDINGLPISDSGRKQAIYLLTGTPNPNPDLYEVQGFYDVNGHIQGVPTSEFDKNKCPAGTISISPQRLLFDTTVAVQLVSLVSSGPWALSATDTAIAGVFAFDTIAGTGGQYTIKVSLLAPNTVAQGNVTFTNLVSGTSVKLYLINVLTKPWILATGTWNMNGFWFDNGLWTY